MTDNEISQDLLIHGIRPSLQRIQIYRYLDEHRTHPTANEIYTRIHEHIHVLSRMTIYNTLKLFEKKGVISPIIIEDAELRYDINTRFHGHFRCQRCGAVYDIFDLLECKIPSDLEGFQVRQQHLYYIGICKQCVENTN